MLLTIVAVILAANAVFWPLYLLVRLLTKRIDGISNQLVTSNSKQTEILTGITTSLGVLATAELKRADEAERLHLKRIEGRKIAADCRSQKTDRANPRKTFIRRRHTRLRSPDSAAGICLSKVASVKLKPLSIRSLYVEYDSWLEPVGLPNLFPLSERRRYSTRRCRFLLRF